MLINYCIEFLRLRDEADLSFCCVHKVEKSIASAGLKPLLEIATAILFMLAGRSRSKLIAMDGNRLMSVVSKGST